MFSRLQDQMRIFLEKKKISVKLRKQIKSYLLFKYYRSTIELFDGMDLIEHTSGKFKTEIASEFAYTLFWHARLLQQFGYHFVQLISGHLKGNCHGPDELIIRG